jgi:DNA-binding MarR family transcriptional regulator
VLHDVVGALERDAGMDSGMFSVLAHLERAQPRGRVPLTALQRLMHPRFSQPGLSRLVQRMETAGLVERRPDPQDGRATTVVMTRAGRAGYRRANETYMRALHEHFGAFVTPGERTRLTTELERVATRLASGKHVV